MAKYIINGNEYNVEITDVQGKLARVVVNGQAYEVETEEKLHAMPTQKAPTARPQVAQVAAHAQAAVAYVAPVAPAAAPVSKPAAAPAVAGSGSKIAAPLPGTITEVKCSVGQKVKAGDTVIILEAMKMQNNIEADCDGVIQQVLVSKGDSVLEGAPMVVIAAEGAPAAPAAAPVAAAPVAAAPTAAPAPAAGAGSQVTAPLPGTITEIKCTVGQAVKPGDTVIILEAMKMQNNIEAETGGVVKQILVGKGDAVMEGAPLVVIG